MLASVVALPLTVYLRDVDRILAFDVANNLADGLLRRNRDQRVDINDHQMPFLDPALLVPSELMEHIAEMFAQLSIQHFPTTFRDKHNMVFTLPLGMA